MKPETPTRLDLDTYLPYLVNRVGSQIAQAFTEEARRQGTTLQGWRVLAALAHHGPLSLSALSAATSIELSTLSRLVQQMERSGLVNRDRMEGDQRVVTISRTDEGKRITFALIPVARAYEQRALAGFSEDESALLRDMLRRIFTNVHGM
ncbi:MAG: MarR family transcriptional regulator [Pseudomonadota bacterium]|nr:MarR family transcriptional regulator [Pseudomonadota bacterium]